MQNFPVAGIHRNEDQFYGPNYIRGRSILTYDQARAYTKAILPAHDYGVFWAGVYIQSEDATNFCVIGIPGSGKTTLLRLMMQATLPLIGLPDKNKSRSQHMDPCFYWQRYGAPDPRYTEPKLEKHRAMVFDVKPEFLPFIENMNLNCPVKVLDPFNSRSCRWDTGKDVSEDEASTFSKLLVPEAKAGDENARFWSNTARGVFSLATRALIRTKGSNWSFPDFVDLMRSSEHYIACIRKYSDLNTEYRECSARKETFDNFRQQIWSHIWELRPAADAWQKASSGVSLKHWCDNEYILVLSRHDAYRASADPLYRLIFGVASHLVLSRPNTTTDRTWFYLDELGEGGILTNLTELMRRGRDKGAAVVIGAQGIPTLENAFGEQSKVEEILELCPYVTILRAGNQRTAKWAQELLGKCEFYETKTGMSVAKAYMRGSSRTDTLGASTTDSEARTVGKSTSRGAGSGITSGTNWGRQKGNSWNQGGSSGGGAYSSNWSQGGSLSDSHGGSSSNSFNTNFSDTENESETLTRSQTESRSTAQGESESQTDTDSRTVNRERLERYLILASQVMDLRTLKYDGSLLGIHVTPFGTYGASLPGEYLFRALHKPSTDASLYERTEVSLVEASEAEEPSEAVSIDARIKQAPLPPIRDRRL